MPQLKLTSTKQNRSIISKVSKNLAHPTVWSSPRNNFFVHTSVASKVWGAASGMISRRLCSLPAHVNKGGDSKTRPETPRASRHPVWSIRLPGQWVWKQRSQTLTGASQPLAGTGRRLAEQVSQTAWPQSLQWCTASRGPNLAPQQLQQSTSPSGCQ